MSIDRDALREFLSRDLLDFFVRVGLLVLAIIACEKIFSPFLPLMLWALILAVCFYPLRTGLSDRFGWSPGRSATLLVLFLILLIGVPTVMLGVSLTTHVLEVATDIRAGEFTIDAPSESVRQWPVVGERVYAKWAAAAADLPATLKQLEPHIASPRQLVGAVGSIAGMLLVFVGAIIVSGIMMAYGTSGASIIGRVFARIAGTDKGPAMHNLSIRTVRSVATGVVGVAFIQALLLGVGFLVAGIPAAGVLALVVLLMGILQLPALLITLPAIAYIWGMGEGGSLTNGVLTVYLIVAGAADGFLKPLLLGRGVDVPMPIVLIGALGGMVFAGIIGLFVGAVVLSVGYELFMGWLVAGEVVEPTDLALEDTDHP